MIAAAIASTPVASHTGRNRAATTVLGASDDARVRAAFEGAHGAFCLANFWESFSAETELEQAGNMARAASAAGIEHAIWSTLEDTRRFIPLDDDRMPTLQGRFKVPHFDAK